MLCSSSVFFFNDTATTEIYTLSLHDALPIYVGLDPHQQSRHRRVGVTFADDVERLKERHAGFHHRCHLAGKEAHVLIADLAAPPEALLVDLGDDDALAAQRDGDHRLAAGAHLTFDDLAGLVLAFPKEIGRAHV